MSFAEKKELVGISTGCVYYHADPVSNEALELVLEAGYKVLELNVSSLERLENVKTLSDALLGSFSLITLHGLCDIFYGNNPETLESFRRLDAFYEKWGFHTLTVHPHMVKDWTVFRNLSFPVSFENMDRKKNFGLTVEDMEKVFSEVPEAGFVFDVHHAISSSGNPRNAQNFAERFEDRIRLYHISGIREDRERHFMLYENEETEFTSCIKKPCPLIIEGTVSENEKSENVLNVLKRELEYVKDIISRNCP